ncbi:MAG: hypothetical protein H6624_16765 [Bdellovibrionaceae bacterium]|nr:hypothetical protein [Bdellovibrionales bacterium]MCB9085998.1 hypothetical protein [Pseudobdellovibrionaceae bacterium]
MDRNVTDSKDELMVGLGALEEASEELEEVSEDCEEEEESISNGLVWIGKILKKIIKN